MARKRKADRRTTTKKRGRPAEAKSSGDSAAGELGGAAGPEAGRPNGHAIELVSELLQVSDNHVRIDELQLEREADAVAIEAGADAAAAAAGMPPSPEEQAAAVQIENAAEGYKILALAVVGQGYELFAPAWHVTVAEKSDMSDALVAALMLWFPDGLIPPKYMALLVIGGIGAKIAIARRDPVTGDLQPRHEQPAVGAAATH